MHHISLAASERSQGSRDGNPSSSKWSAPMNEVMAAIKPSRSVSTLIAQTEIRIARLGPQIAGDGRLAVRARQAVLPGTAGERHTDREVRHGGQPAVPVRQRWHRPGDVGGEQLDERVDVPVLERAGVAGHDLAQPSVADVAERRLLGARGYAAVHRGPSALQRRCSPKRPRCPSMAAISAALNPSTSNKQQGSSLVARQVLQRRDEGQLDRRRAPRRARRDRRGECRDKDPTRRPRSAGGRQRPARSLAGPRSIGSARRLRCASASRQQRVATV